LSCAPSPRIFLFNFTKLAIWEAWNNGGHFHTSLKRSLKDKLGGGDRISRVCVCVGGIFLSSLLHLPPLPEKVNPDYRTW
jgi:hypothetical protein